MQVDTWGQQNTSLFLSNDYGEKELYLYSFDKSWKEGKIIEARHFIEAVANINKHREADNKDKKFNLPNFMWLP